MYCGIPLERLGSSGRNTRPLEFINMGIRPTQPVMDEVGMTENQKTRHV